MTSVARSRFYQLRLAYQPRHCSPCPGAPSSSCSEQCKGALRSRAEKGQPDQFRGPALILPGSWRASWLPTGFWSQLQEGALLCQVPEQGRARSLVEGSLYYPRCPSYHPGGLLPRETRRGAAFSSLPLLSPEYPAWYLHCSLFGHLLETPFRSAITLLTFASLLLVPLPPVYLYSVQVFTHTHPSWCFYLGFLLCCFIPVALLLSLHYTSLSGRYPIQRTCLPEMCN